MFLDFEFRTTRDASEFPIFILSNANCDIRCRSSSNSHGISRGFRLLPVRVVFRFTLRHFIPSVIMCIILTLRQYLRRIDGLLFRLILSSRWRRNWSWIPTVDQVPLLYRRGWAVVPIQNILFVDQFNDRDSCVLSSTSCSIGESCPLVWAFLNALATKARDQLNCKNTRLMEDKKTLDMNQSTTTTQRRSFEEPVKLGVCRF